MHKQTFTWPLAATSWLWPKTLKKNLQKIAAWDLPIKQAALLFYRHAESLAYDPGEFEARPGLATHAHLPLDLPWPKGAAHCWDILRRLMDLASPLAPWGGVLHPPADPRVLEDLARLWRGDAPGWRLLVENVPGRDLRDHWPVIEALDLPVCLDVGHLMAFSQHWLLDAPGFFARVELVHCYAPGIVVDDHEHLPLTQLSPGQRATLKRVMESVGPETPVLFEVFAESDLRESLKAFYELSRNWRLPE